MLCPVLGLGDEALDAEAFDRGDLIVDARELGVHLRDCRDEGPGSTGRRSASADGRRPRKPGRRSICLGGDARHSEPRRQATRQESPSVDSARSRLAEPRASREALLIPLFRHL